MFIGCLHQQNEILVNEIQNISQKVINREVLIRFGDRQHFPIYLGNTHNYQACESNYFIVARAIGIHKALFII